MARLRASWRVTPDRRRNARTTETIAAKCRVQSISEPSLPFIGEFIYDLILNWQHVLEQPGQTQPSETKRPRHIPRPLRRTKPAMG